MQDEVAAELLARTDLMDRLIAQGKLPDTPAIWPRFFYLGHTVVCGYSQPDDQRQFRCCACMLDWTGAPVAPAQGWSEGACPSCGQAEQVFQLNIDRTARWRCCQCSHEWVSEEGETCPACGAVKR